MRIDQAGWPFIVGALRSRTCSSAWWLGRVWAVPFVVLVGFFVFFFRDPDRAHPRRRDPIVSPADGRVMIVGEAAGAGRPAREWQQISIFLSPMDVHINRAPVDGCRPPRGVSRRQVPAGLQNEAGTHNEWTEVWFDHHGTLVVCRQIVGILARRIVTRLAVGQQVAAANDLAS